MVFYFLCLLKPSCSLFSRTVHYYAELGQCSVFSATEAPEQFINQVTVLKYFSHYMEENLMDVSCTDERLGNLFIKVVQVSLVRIKTCSFFL